MRGRGIKPTSASPWRVLVALVALGPLGWWSTRPEPPVPAPSLAVCEDNARSEHVIVLLDDSGSVIELDPANRRLAAVHSLVGLMAAEPCTDDDLVSVISFTDETTLTGPAKPADLGRIRQDNGDGTDINNAVRTAIDLASNDPGARTVTILISDYEDGSAVPIDQTLDQIGVYDGVLVSIGDSRRGVALSSLDITRDLAEVINTSRSQP